VKLKLDGPRAKLARAIEHERAFGDALNDYLAQRPIMLRLNDQPDGWVELELVHRLPFPDRISAVFADMIQNLESALDLLVTQLVIANDKPPSSGNYMPIATSEDRWKALRPDKLKGVSDEHAEIIKRHQPITWEEDGASLDTHPLVVIHEANRINKHTLLTPIVIASGEFEPEYQLNRDARETGEFAISENSPYGVGAQIEHGHVIGRSRVVSADGDLKIVGVTNPDNIQGRIGFGFPGIEPSDTDLIRYVIQVLQPFEEIAAAEG